MPNLSEVLERARKLVAGGWHEPLSLAADGTICDVKAEGIERFCVNDALTVAAADDFGAIVDAELALVKQLQLSGERRSLTAWLEDKHRGHGDVLALFTRAAAHARAEESR